MPRQPHHRAPTYGYKGNRPVPSLPAQAVGEELERIRGLLGELTPEGVVNESRGRDALLHKELDLHLSAKVRAEMWSVHKARNVINVVIVYPEKPDGGDFAHPQPAYVNITEGSAVEPTSRGYQPIEDIMADPALRANYVQRCLEKLLRVQREFRHLQEFASIWSAIDTVAQTLGA
jgi:hypothetical protein